MLLPFVILAFVFGTAIGSFLNVVIWRLPQEQSLGGRSQCPHCHNTLRARELVPVLSYLALRRRCANCKQPISSRYMWIELLTGLLFAVSAYSLPTALSSGFEALTLVRLLFIISVLIVVFVIDLEHYLILDVVVLPAALVILGVNIALDLVHHQSLFSLSAYTGGGIVAAVLAGGFFWLIWRISKGLWMGFGDVKLNLVLGLVLGLPGIAVGLFLSFILGSVVGIGLIAFGQKQLSSRIPFGTFLSAATVITLFYGPALAAWYGQLIGWR